MLLSFRWNYFIANHCSDAPRRELAREPLPTNRAKAPVQTSARNRASLLPPTDAIMSSGRLEQLNILNMIMPVRRKARAVPLRRKARAVPMRRKARAVPLRRKARAVPLRRTARAVPLRRKRNGTRAGGPRGRRPAKLIKVYTWFAHWYAGSRKSLIKVHLSVCKR